MKGRNIGKYKIIKDIENKSENQKKTDLWESTQKHGKNYFDVTMKKCLWHTACIENDCAKLCHLFCDVDNVTYGELKKIGFSRTKTLGYGKKIIIGDKKLENANEIS